MHSINITEYPMQTTRWLYRAAIALVMTATSALANEANYQNFVIGERAAGMGGAGSALASTIDACYYNPAGLGDVEQSTISLSANLYGWQRYNSDDSLAPGEDVGTVSFVSIPSSMSTIIDLGPEWAIAFSTFVPNRYSLAEILAFTDSWHFYKASMDDQTLRIGPSAGYRVSPELAFGASVFGLYRTYSSFQNMYKGTEVSAGTGSRDLKYNNMGALAMLGAQYQPIQNWKLGFTFQTPSVNISGSGEYHGDYINIGQQDESGFAYVDNMDSRNDIPAKMVFGLGWEKARIAAFGIDVSWHLANSYNRLEGTFDVTGEPAISKYRNEAVVDVSLGGEVYVYQRYPVRAGFFTSRSAAPDIDFNTTDYPAQIDLYGLTASVGRESEHINMSVGVNYVFGSGDDYGYSANNETGEYDQIVVDANEKQLYLFFTTAYLF